MTSHDWLLNIVPHRIWLEYSGEYILSECERVAELKENAGADAGVGGRGGRPLGPLLRLARAGARGGRGAQELRRRRAFAAATPRARRGAVPARSRARRPRRSVPPPLWTCRANYNRPTKCDKRDNYIFLSTLSKKAVTHCLPNRGSWV